MITGRVASARGHYFRCTMYNYQLGPCRSLWCPFAVLYIHFHRYYYYRERFWVEKTLIGVVNVICMHNIYIRRILYIHLVFHLCVKKKNSIIILFNLLIIIKRKYSFEYDHFRSIIRSNHNVSYFRYH